MRNRILTGFTLVVMSVLWGCSQPKTPPTTSSTPATASISESSGSAESILASRVTTAMAELSVEDRELAMAQKFCAVADGSRLGSMGTPYKIEVEGKPVFLCCEGCKEGALEDPHATLAKVEKLKSGDVSPEKQE